MGYSPIDLSQANLRMQHYKCSGIDEVRKVEGARAVRGQQQPLGACTFGPTRILQLCAAFSEQPRAGVTVVPESQDPHNLGEGYRTDAGSR